jgi:hypothetical protein
VIISLNGVAGTLFACDRRRDSLELYRRSRCFHSTAQYSRYSRKAQIIDCDMEYHETNLHSIASVFYRFSIYSTSNCTILVLSRISLPE